MSQPLDCLIFIGRFEPFHHGHEFVITEALKRTNRLIILIGSANSPRTTKNPFTYDERAAMILEAFDHDDRIVCVPIHDYPYNDQKWLAQVQSVINRVLNLPSIHHARIGIIGHTKDESSYYLSLFPQWQAIELPNFNHLSATPLRNRYLATGEIDSQMPSSSQNFLANFQHTDDYARLHTEYRHIQDFKDSWSKAPYPPVFSTADALVVQAGHVLLIERGGDYGRGLWALPGGFLDQHESLMACAIRELHEETGLIVQPSTLKSSQIFDKPDRSPRGRTITQVFHFELTGDVLPSVMGNDDANRAFWLPLGELDGKMMFEDHYGIIIKMLGL